MPGPAALMRPKSRLCRVKISLQHLSLVRRRRNPLLLSLQPQRQQLRVIPAQRQKAHHNPKVLNTSLLPRNIKLTLLINAPNTPAAFRNTIAESLAHSVLSIREPGSENNEIELSLSSTGEDDFVLGEFLNVAVFDFDLAVDDVLACSGVEVETSVSCLA